VTRSNAGIVKATFDLWISKYPGERPNDGFDANKLANVRRFIVKNKKLSDVELDNIKFEVRQALKQSSPEPQLPSQELSHSQEELAHHDQHISDAETVQAEDEYDQSAGADNSCTENTQLYRDIMNTWEEVKCASFVNRGRLPRILFKTPKQKELLNEVNCCVNVIIANTSPTLSELNALLYAAAVCICRIRGFTVNISSKASESKPYKSSGHDRVNNLQNQIDELRGDLSIISEVVRGNSSSRVAAKFRSIKRKHKFERAANLDTIKFDLTMRLKVLVQRLRRAKRRKKQYEQNHLFSTNAKTFFRQLSNKEIVVSEMPPLDQTLGFWKGIWERSDSFNIGAGWLKREKTAQEQTPEMQWTPISLDDLNTAIKCIANWKAPGLDGLPNFWLKYLSSAHNHLVKCFNDIFSGAVELPSWFVTGSTRLIPKNVNTSDPKNYRPITCLPTMYKLLTSILTNRLYHHFDTNKILAPEQRGCRRECYGCRDLLLIDKMILEDCHMHKKKMSTMWIDYCKAYDSVPHSWIIESLKLYKVAPDLVLFLERCMSSWNTQVFMVTETDSVDIGKVSINCGIFQGDSLSPLLFCIALNPLSSELRASNTGYKPSSGNMRFSHSFYMDDLKCYARDETELSTQLCIVEQFSSDINMRIGTAKCAKATFHAGTLVESEGFPLKDCGVINDVNVEGCYKYLGIDQCEEMLHSKMKTKVIKEYLHRCRQILSSELNSKNKIQAINMFAVPILRYGCGILNWTQAEVSKLDVATRKALNRVGMHHPTADVDRLYVWRSDGGRGLLNLVNVWKATIVSIATYLAVAAEVDQFLSVVKSFQTELCQSKSLLSLATKFQNEYSVHHTVHTQNPTIEAKRAGISLKKSMHSTSLENWKGKALHGRFFDRLNKPFVDKKISLSWLNGSRLKGVSEGFICAAQDQSLRTRNYSKHVLHENIDDKCRLCHKSSETLDHLLSSCEVLAKTEYINRHNTVAKYIHWNICRASDFECSSVWWKHQPSSVLDSERYLIMWDKAIITDLTIAANRPDIVFSDKLNKRTLLIDVSCPCDSNIALKHTEKVTKYQLLKDEVHRMWGTSVSVVPVVVGALGIVKKGQVEIVKNIPGNSSMFEIQKSVLLGSMAILRKTLNIDNV